MVAEWYGIVRYQLQLLVVGGRWWSCCRRDDGGEGTIESEERNARACVVVVAAECRRNIIIYVSIVSYRTIPYHTYEREEKSSRRSPRSKFEVVCDGSAPPRWRLASKASTISSFANYRGAQLWHSATNARDARFHRLLFSFVTEIGSFQSHSSDIRHEKKTSYLI